MEKKPALTGDLFESTIEEIAVIHRRIVGLASKVQELANEMVVLVAALQDQKPKRNGRELDDNGEPTWNFAVAVKIPKDLFLTKRFRVYAEGLGFKGKDLTDQWEGFVNWYTRKGSKWMHWSKVWFDWCRREQQRRQQLVNTQGAPGRTSKSLSEY